MSNHALNSLPHKTGETAYAVSTVIQQLSWDNSTDRIQTHKCTSNAVESASENQSSPDSS